ncbi:MAG: hypothetical protein KGL37_13505 [Acidobacteriota bacterium]|nr:hypothetical protein [Acidobacteriota bacterium]
MATLTTTELPIAVSTPATGASPMPLNRRRRITPDAGHALEILGHAIEYLTDELVQGGGPLSPNDAQLEAIQLLMALNREVYYACPEVLSFGERCRSLLGLRTV